MKEHMGHFCVLETVRFSEIVLSDHAAFLCFQYTI